MTREQKLKDLALEELNKIKKEAQSKAASDEDFDPPFLAIALGRVCGILDGLNEELEKCSNPVT
jgi:hypothetical protein